MHPSQLKKNELENFIKNVGKKEGEIDELAKNVPSPSVKGPLSPPLGGVVGGCVVAGGVEVVVGGAGC
jgi:hypothetical protein